jgi:hypothetical protein
MVINEIYIYKRSDPSGCRCLSFYGTLGTSQVEAGVIPPYGRSKYLGSRRPSETLPSRCAFCGTAQEPGSSAPKQASVQASLTVLPLAVLNSSGATAYLMVHYFTIRSVQFLSGIL